MRVAGDSLENCQSLFEGFLEQIQVVNTFRNDLFEAVHDERDLYSETLRVLSSYAADRCVAVYCLLVNGLVWDAEIVLRTFYEAVVKCLFLSTAPDDARERLLNEFWETLPAIYDVKGAERAKIAQKLARRHGSLEDERVFSALQDERLFKVKHTANQKVRKEIENRWSFSKMVDTLNRGLDGHRRVSSIDSLFHGYGMASHVAHASPKAFDLLEDRALRGSDLVHLEASHIARMLSDMVSLSVFMLHQAQVGLLGPMPLAKALLEAFDQMMEIARPFQEAFQRSQDDFYHDDASL